MKLRITRIDKSLELPQYETNGSVGLDLIVREDTVINPGEIVLIPANIIIETPKGWMFMIVSRSSTPKKKGLKFPHSIGIIDQDYCGPEDEVKIQVYNFTDKPTTVHRGDKIAQGIFVKVDKMEFEEVDDMRNETRGGFGSTDNKA